MINAIVIEDTQLRHSARLTTLQVTMHRSVLAQFSKHRMFSINASSSRAVPTKKFIKQVISDPALPVFWGANKSGMVADNQLTGIKLRIAKLAYHLGRYSAVISAYIMHKAGLHKQITNRTLEPYLWETVVVTATEWDNFFNLRLAKDTQPEMQEVARSMKKAMDNSKPQNSKTHLPYVTTAEKSTLSLELLLKISAARCARVSYLKHNKEVPSVEEDVALADRLLEAKHMTCFEHQALVATSCKFYANFNSFRSYRYDIEKQGNLYSRKFGNKIIE